MTKKRKGGNKKTDVLALGELRAGIDVLDNEIIELLNRRAQLAMSIGTIKQRLDQPYYVPEREQALLKRLVERNRGPLADDSLLLIYKEIISASLALERPLQVAYLGPEATFTHEATKRHFGQSAKLLPQVAIRDVFEEVERGAAQYGVVPIENSTEGVVTHTLDVLMQSELSICAEILVDVHHCLLSKSGDAACITKIYSHPQALAQCRNWLQENMSGIVVEGVASTARAAQIAATDSTAAAVAGEMAAAAYDLQVVAQRIEDARGNITRFLVIGTEGPKATGVDRTSIMFALKDAPGILFRALKSFADMNINLSRIESRPSRRRAWDYLFFIDLEGHRDEPKVDAAVRGLSESCEFIKVLGSYPQAKSVRKRPIGPKVG